MVHKKEEGSYHHNEKCLDSSAPGKVCWGFLTDPKQHTGSLLLNAFWQNIFSLYFWLFVMPWTSAHQASLSITNSWSLPKPMSVESVMPSNHLILCYPLLLLPSILASIRVFSNESALSIRWPNIGVAASTSVLPMNYPGLISFRMDCLDLLAVQGTRKSLLQHHSSKASIFQRSACFIVQLSHAYMTTGKTKALTRWTFWTN